MTNHWVIRIQGYGTFIHEGNEKSAEEMRVHKSRWGKGVGWKRPATAREIDSGECLPDDGLGLRAFAALSDEQIQPTAKQLNEMRAFGGERGEP